MVCASCRSPNVQIALLSRNDLKYHIVMNDLLSKSKIIISNSNTLSVSDDNSIGDTIIVGEDDAVSAEAAAMIQ
jgi:hypothetical protein